MAKSPNTPRRRAPASTSTSRGGYRGIAYRVGGAAVIALAAAVVWVAPWKHSEPPKRDLAVATATPPKPVVAPLPVAAPQPPAQATRSIVAPPAETATMSPSEAAAFDAWLMGVYKQCWAAPKSVPEGEAYLPKIRVAFKADGGLAGAPKLVNPPSDPAWKPHAEAAMRAVKSCDPLHIPEKFASLYPAWKSKTVYFDPTQ